MARTRVGGIVKLKQDTKFHKATGYLTPYGVSLELYDAYEGRSVFRIEAHAWNPQGLVAKLSPFVDSEGVTLILQDIESTCKQNVSSTMQSLNSCNPSE